MAPSPHAAPQRATSSRCLAPDRALDAERAVLASMVLDNAAIEQARRILDPSKFHLVAHQRIFSALVTLNDRSEKADLITLADQLRQQGDLEVAGGTEGLGHLLEYATASANLEAHARIVLIAYRKRELRRAALQCIERISNGEDFEQASAALLQRLDQLGHNPTETRVKVTRMSEVRAERVRWLWPGWIPLGMLTVLDGDPGLGKSTAMLDIAARLSRGSPMPDNSKGPDASGVIVLSSEDDVARVIRPRLELAGANLDRVVFLEIPTGEPGELRPPAISPDDLRCVEEAVDRIEAKLLIVDPLMAFLPEDVNANRDQDVRRALARLRALAERTGVAVVAIRHLNKTGTGNPLYRGGGSIGIIGAARAGLLVAIDPEDPASDNNCKRRILAATKMNLAPLPTSYAFRLVAKAGDDHPTVEWDGPCKHAARELLAAEEIAGQTMQRKTRMREREQPSVLEDEAAAALREKVASWVAAGEPMRKNPEAIRVLLDFGLPRDRARDLIRQRKGRDWRLEGGGRKGDPEVLLPVVPHELSQASRGAESPQDAGSMDGLIPAVRANQGPHESAYMELAQEAGGVSSQDSCGASGVCGGARQFSETAPHPLAASEPTNAKGCTKGDER